MNLNLPSLFLLSKIKKMSDHSNLPVEDKEFGRNWVTTSKWIFLTSVFGFLFFVGGCSLNLYKHRYKGKPKVEVPTSTEYNPKYK